MSKELSKTRSKFGVRNTTEENAYESTQDFTQVSKDHKRMAPF